MSAIVVRSRDALEHVGLGSELALSSSPPQSATRMVRRGFAPDGFEDAHGFHHHRHAGGIVGRSRRRLFTLSRWAPSMTSFVCEIGSREDRR